jgi:hypothetical protein
MTVGRMGWRCEGKSARPSRSGWALGVVVALDDGDFEGETLEMFVN